MFALGRDRAVAPFFLLVGWPAVAPASGLSGLALFGIRRGDHSVTGTPGAALWHAPADARVAAAGTSRWASAARSVVEIG